MNSFCGKIKMWLMENGESILYVVIGLCLIRGCFELVTSDKLSIIDGLFIGIVTAANLFIMFVNRRISKLINKEIKKEYGDE